MRPKNIKELFAVLRREFGRQEGGRLPAVRQRPAPGSGFSVWRLLVLASLTTKMMAGTPDSHKSGKVDRASKPETPRARVEEDYSQFQGAGRPMPPDVIEQVRTLLREHPDQREQILADAVWKGWRVDGL